jgi:hypothetical protein
MATNSKAIVVMKAIVIILILTGLSSCSSYKIYNETNCNIDEQLIINELKKQKVKISVAKIRNYFMAKDKINCSIFHFRISDWKNITNRRNFVGCIILKTSANTYINTYYINGRLRKKLEKQTIDNYIDYAIQSFKQENNLNFDEETLYKIEQSFRYGIEIFVPYY